MHVTVSFTFGRDGVQLIGGGGGSGTSTVVDLLSLPTALRTVSEMVLRPGVLHLGEWIELEADPLESPPLHMYVSGSVPDTVGEQVTAWFIVADDGQPRLLIVGGVITLTVVDSLSLPTALRTVNETVFVPAELQLGK